MRASTQKKASRKTISCENCRARKVRCSRESPCQHCTKRGEQCVWKADAHPLVRHTKGHSYVETDSTTLHKAIDALASRLTMSSDDVDELIRSFAPSGSSSASHSESESLSDTAGSPLLSPSGSASISPKRESISPPAANFGPPLPPAALSAWPAGSPVAQHPSFTMPLSMQPSAAAYAAAADSWGRPQPQPQQQLPAQDQLMSFSFGSASNFVLPQPTTPSAFPPTMNGFFEPMGMPASSAMQAQSFREPEASFNNWLTAALGPLGGPYSLPARSNFMSPPVLA